MKALSLFSHENLHEYTNIVDMFYNFYSNNKYHDAHQTASDTKAIKQNTPGLVAAHQFAEYLMFNRNIGYVESLDTIIDEFDTLDKLDSYVGTSLANATWRMAAIYLDKTNTERSPFPKPFNEIRNDASELHKDIIQLQGCAFLLKSFIQGRSMTTLLPAYRSGEVTLGHFPLSAQAFIQRGRGNEPCGRLNRGVFKNYIAQDDTLGPQLDTQDNIIEREYAREREWETICTDPDRLKKMTEPEKMKGLNGGSKAAARWSPTARKATLKDGSKRVLYKNPKFPGELRVRKMRQGKDGRMTATYVKPPK